MDLSFTGTRDNIKTRAVVRRHRRAVLPCATGALSPVITLTSRQSNARFLYSRLRHPLRIDFPACFGGHKSNRPFSNHLEAVSSRSHKVLLSFVKKLTQEIYGKSDCPLTGFFTIMGRISRGSQSEFTPDPRWHCNISGSLGGVTRIHLNCHFVARRALPLIRLPPMRTWPRDSQPAPDSRVLLVSGESKQTSSDPAFVDFLSILAFCPRRRTARDSSSDQRDRRARPEPSPCRRFHLAGRAFSSRGASFASHSVAFSGLPHAT